MNIFTTLRTMVEEALATLDGVAGLPGGLENAVSGLAVEPPRDPAHGDVSTNAALVLAKPLARPPRALAGELARVLARHGDIASAEVAGPGFVNMRLKPAFWQRHVAAILAAGKDYGRGAQGAGHKVNVEYVSANPTGPLHIGHCRGAVFGDALANLLAFAGYGVTREYYINDAGAQIDSLARSLHWRYREALGEASGAMPEGLYPGDYLKPVGMALAQEWGGRYAHAGEAEWLSLFKRRAVDAMMALIKRDLGALGIRQEVFFSEQSLHADGRIAAMIARLEAEGHVYTGVLAPPKGKEPEGWEPRAQKLFRATAFGDDVDRPLQKSDGSYTYFAADIAYHYDKICRGFADMIDVWGADHGGYVRRLQAAVKALSDGKAALDVKIVQMVRLFRAGEPYKMSKRAGTFVTLADLVDEVGKDVVRFLMLTRRNDAPLDFDLAKALEQSRDNPVFYVQYAHARICSVLRKIAAAFPELDDTDLSLLSHDEELALVKRLAAWPRLVEAAAQAHEPHRVAFYLYELASAFHALWNRGNDEPALRFLVEDEPGLTGARAALIRAVREVIANGMAVLGVTPMEEM
ncbi:MAG: arginine--tRNA ligase [Pseudomonadota bacterium]